jgi:RimJ/RimL family protein N-acetyltransferase
MPRIELRQGTKDDLDALIHLDHRSQVSSVWQMERSIEERGASVIFREAPLPRPAWIEYPYAPQSLAERWRQFATLLVAVLDGQPVGYAGVRVPYTGPLAWISDLVVGREWRRQGVASALVLAIDEWSYEQGLHRVVMEMSSKNTAAIHLAQKLGFEFGGYHEQYFANQDIAVFFTYLVK